MAGHCQLLELLLFVEGRVPLCRRHAVRCLSATLQTVGANEQPVRLRGVTRRHSDCWHRLASLVGGYTPPAKHSPVNLMSLPCASKPLCQHTA